MSKRTDLAIQIGREAIEVMIARGREYGNNNIQKDAMSIIMKLLYPNGFDELDEGIRYKYISQIVDKLCRYRLNGKQDNLIDLANYAFLLAAFDEEQQEEIQE